MTQTQPDPRLFLNRKKEYKVSNLEDNIYQVFEAHINEEIEILYWDVVFQGTLPECEAWINLTEKGYL
jgi:hypothetical protein